MKLSPRGAARGRMLLTPKVHPSPIAERAREMERAFGELETLLDAAVRNGTFVWTTEADAELSAFLDDLGI